MGSMARGSETLPVCLCRTGLSAANHVRAAAGDQVTGIQALQKKGKGHCRITTGAFLIHSGEVLVERKSHELC